MGTVSSTGVHRSLIGENGPGTTPFTGDEDRQINAAAPGWGLSGVLRLAKLTDAEYVLEQVAGGLEDYYLGAGEAPGVWTGRLAAEFGLAGTVTPDDLRALIDRRQPGTAEALGGPKQPTVQAINATFSAPKSVSLLWAFGTEEIAAAVSIAHVEAVEAALASVESKAAVTRRQTGGVRVRAASSGWAAATFVHRTSREATPSSTPTA